MKFTSKEVLALTTKHYKYTNILQNVTLKKYKIFSNITKKLLIL